MRRLALIMATFTVIVGAAFAVLLSRAPAAAGPVEQVDDSEARPTRLADPLPSTTAPEPPARSATTAVPPVTLPAPPAPPPPVVLPQARTLAVDTSGAKVPAADPALIRDGDVWRVYTTQFRYTNVPMWESDDLVTWTRVGDVLPTLPAWVKWGKTWAPDVTEIDGQWVLFFSARHEASGMQCIGHAVAADAAGPFTAFPEPIVCPIDDGGAIDPMVFQEGNGQLRLLWKVDANAIGRASVLRSQALSADGLTLEGDPSDLLRYEGGWEWPLIEQPEMVARDGELHLFYAAGWYNTENYQVGHAVCESVAGPCERTSTDGGWIVSSPGIAGPGALSVMEIDGDLVGAYHGWIDAIGAPDTRSLIIEPLSLIDGIPRTGSVPVGD